MKRESRHKRRRKLLQGSKSNFILLSEVGNNNNSDIKSNEDLPTDYFQVLSRLGAVKEMSYNAIGRAVAGDVVKTQSVKPWCTFVIFVYQSRVFFWHIFHRMITQ